MKAQDTVDPKMTTELVEYAQELVASSQFFSGLERGVIGPCRVRYVFEQYGLWRDAFHCWFGLALMKSGSCTQQARSSVIASLAQHVLAEIRDDHATMYQGLLHDLGIKKNDKTCESVATREYRRSFAQRFGTGEYNFADAIVALSGRELLASVRNQSLQRSLAVWYQVAGSQWLDLHESLEIEHFSQTIGPFMTNVGEQGIARFTALIRQEMALHVFYWDELLRESLCRV